jgi:hypothetical protein
MPGNEELRQFLRVDADIEAEIEAAGGRVCGTTRDLSLKGMFVHVSQSFPEGSTCSVLMRLDGQAGAVAVRAKGYVSRASSDGMAIEFTDIIGLDSWDHLRGLVLLNAADSQRAQEQLASHLGLRSPDESGQW